MNNQEIFALIDRFERGCLRSLKLCSGDVSIELTKGGPECPPVPVSVQPALPSDDLEHTISAPLVGTYYAAPAPDAPPFAAVGGRFHKGDTLCLIEAMKTISEVPAPCDCVITQVLKENGSLAAFQEPLFRYEPC